MPKPRLAALLLLLGSLFATAAAAEKKYDPGASDTTIKIGQTLPYSGPLSMTSVHGLFQQAFFKVLNEEGGINGRKIEFISLDDGYSPPKTVEQTRKLVEDDQVLFLFGSLGSPTNAAVQKYLNAKKIPQLFITAGATRFTDWQQFPWTLGYLPTYSAEGAIYAKYILQNIKEPKIAILYQNDDLGKDFVGGFKRVLGADAAKLIVSELTFETSDPTVDSQIVSLHSSGANVLFYAGTQKFGAQEIRKTYDIGWKPAHFIVSTTSSIASVLAPAHIVDKAEGLISAQYLKDVADPTWKDDKGVVEFLAWMKSHLPSADPLDVNNVNGYLQAKLLVHVLKQCGDDLTRANIMRQATSLKDFDLPMMLPGIRLNTSPNNYVLIRERQLVRMEHGAWARLGEPISVP